MTVKTVMDKDKEKSQGSDNCLLDYNVIPTSIL